MTEIAPKTPGTAREGSDEEVPSEEEIEVMHLVVEGLSDYVIARRLGISIRTVRRRARRFCKRMNAQTRVEAAAIAIRRGWL